MYRALSRLKAARGSSRGANAGGADVAEVAVCLAAGERSPLILACAARGARTVGKASRVIKGSRRKLTTATLAAVDALLQHSMAQVSLDRDSVDHVSLDHDAADRNALNREATAIVCAGALDSGPEAERDYRAAFRFAARHKLPILYVVANHLGHGQPLDLRSLYPEFGIPLFTVDAADAIAAYRVATEALHNAHHLRGPCVIEALTLTRPLAGADHNPLALLAAYMKRHGNPPE